MIPSNCLLNLFFRPEAPLTLSLFNFFFRRSLLKCGACKYIKTGFLKICEATAETRYAAAGIRFFQTNIENDEGDLTLIGEEYTIKVVPTFILFWKGTIAERLSTREKAKLLEAIERVLTENGALTSESLPMA